MTAKELAQRTEETAALKHLWADLLGPAPESAQFWRWLDAFGFHIMQSAIERTARKFAALGGAMDADYKQRYTTAVAKQRRDATVTQ